MGMTLGSFASRSVATMIVATDGTGDHTDIQEAIDSLPATGGCVYVKEGIYTITSSINITIDNVSINGCGKSTQINTTMNNKMIYVNGADNVTLTNFYLKGNSIGGGQLGIRVSGSSNLIVENILIEDMGALGIYFVNNCNNSFIVRCHIYNVGTHGVLFRGSYCGLIDNRISTTGDHGVWCVGTDFCVVSSNTFYACKNHSIFLSGSEHTICTNNVVRYSGAGVVANIDGIKVDNSDQMIISNNNVYRGTGWGINVSGATCDDTIVTSNLIQGFGGQNLQDNGTDTEIGHNIET